MDEAATDSGGIGAGRQEAEEEAQNKRSSGGSESLARKFSLVPRKQRCYVTLMVG